MTYVLPLYKADAERRLVFARAAMEEPDKSREILDYLSAKPQFEAWSKQYSDATMGKSLGNIRSMHNPRHLAGKVQDLVFDDASKTVDVCIKVLDPVDWTKVEEGGYTGLSIGGGYLKKWTDPADPTLTRYTPRIAEISLVDSPCIPSARILELQKSDGETVQVMLKGVPRLFADMQPPRTFDELNKTIVPPFALAAAGYHAGGKIGAEVGHKIGAGLSYYPGRSRRYGETGEFVGRQIGRGLGVATGSDAGVAIEAVNAREHKRQMKRNRKLHATLGKQELNLGLNKNLGAALAPHAIRAARHIGYRILPGIVSSAAGIGGGMAVAHAARRVGGRIARRMVERNEAAGNAFPSLKPRQQGIPKGAVLPEGSRVHRSLGERLTTKQKERLAIGALGATVGGYAAGGAVGHFGTKHAVRRADRKLTGTDDRMRRATEKAAKKSELDFGPLLAKLELDKAASDGEREKIHQTMHEFKHGQLHSFRAGMPKKKMPKVTDRRQAVAIALSQARRLGKQHDSAVFDQILRKLDRTPDDETDQMPSGHAANPHPTGSIEAIKHRWLQDGHADLDAHFGTMMDHADRASLGHAEKIAAVADQRDGAWRAIGEAHAAYDHVRKHMPDDHHLMMEVPHMAGLLYNPEHVGNEHFDHSGKAKHPITLLHPTEASDWVDRHGKRISKQAPVGLVTDIRQITDRVATA